MYASTPVYSMREQITIHFVGVYAAPLMHPDCAICWYLAPHVSSHLLLLLFVPVLTFQLLALSARGARAEVRGLAAYDVTVGAAFLGQAWLDGAHIMVNTSNSRSGASGWPWTSRATWWESWPIKVRRRGCEWSGGRGCRW
jgi:hypothetical protein